MNNKSQGLSFAYRYSSQISTAIALIILCIVMSFLSDSFLSVGNLLTVTNQVVYIALMAIGMTALFMLGAIDLSVGSTLALSACIMGHMTNQMGVATVPAVLVALCVSVLCGLINGLLVTKVMLPPFVATLGTSYIYRGLAAIITNAKNALVMPDWLRWVAAGKIGNQFPRGIIVLVLFYIVAWFVLEKTPFGLKIKSIGGNEKAARLSGIAIDKMKIKTYMLTGLLCGVSGMMLAGRLNFTTSTMATGAELSCIVAGVVGGTSMNGGSGSVWGTLIGSLLMGVINNGLNLLNVSQFWQSVAMGALVILAVAVDSFRQASQNKVKKEA